MTRFKPKAENQTYEVDREAFILWAFNGYKAKVDRFIVNLKQDLVMGGEFVITADELFSRFTAIPASMVLNYEGKDSTVYTSKCHLVYKRQPKKQL